MKCEEARDELIAYARGELAAERRAAVEEHLVRCAGCTRELEGARQVMALTQMADDESIAALAKSIIATAIKSGASDIHLEKTGPTTPRVRLRIDGVLQDGPAVTAEQYEPLVTRVKMMAGLDLAERRVTQDGRIGLSIEGKGYDLRTSVVPYIYGESVVIRILDKSHAMVGLERLGFLPEVLAQIEDLLTRPSGMLIAAGPTGAGKTTTLYSMLKKLNQPQVKVMTVEDPVECQLPGANQLQVNVRAGMTFASAIRSFLRQDPDVLLVGEIRDLETAYLCIQAAMTGNLVLTCLHPPDAPSGLARLVEMGVEPFLVPASVIGVLSQRLVRKVCQECRTPYEATPEMLVRLGITPEPGAGPVTFYRGKGCDRCRQTGYRGREGIHELLVMNDEIADLVVRRAPICDIREAARAAGMKTLREDGLRKAAMGITTVEEVMRAVFVGG